ncbi:MAG: tetratricopeptide repeat protein [Xanthomonadales bacterium]|nr:tetratricopeptide repeat protein [Xanthomonadales bacterium]
MLVLALTRFRARIIVPVRAPLLALALLLPVCALAGPLTSASMVQWLSPPVSAALAPASSGLDSAADKVPESTSASGGFTPAAGQPGHVGAVVCGQCHASQYRDWQGSHHQLAMQEAAPDSVLGDFDQARLDAGTAFRREGDRFLVDSVGADGRSSTLQVLYTFGVEPLQQYLVALPGGRLQALGYAWDSRAQDQGGQRWFHLYPDQGARPGQPLHWSSRHQNWNFMCADCHGTGVVKGWDPGQAGYQTGWAEINVACEACHGPGQAHVDWARAGANDDEGDDADGNADVDDGQGGPQLAVIFDERRGVSWQPDPATGTAVRSRARDARIEIDTCGRCHGRASRLADNAHGATLLDSHRPVLLEPGQYHPDGQVLAEVFTWGPFLQSRMQAAGVTCADCHQPHSLKLRAPGNALCAQCHQPARFDGPQHHRHAVDGAGSRCLDCHMPATTFMQVDDRHDHAFRIPRPDRSLQLGLPNACNQCHADRDAAWAADALAGWFPPRDRVDDFAPALHLAASGGPGLRPALAAIIGRPSQPAIVRASALRALAPWLDPATLPVAVQALADPDPLVRMAAVEALAGLPPALQAEHLAAVLADPVRAVRIEAARILAGAAEGLLDAGQQQAFDRALGELLAALEREADQPEAAVRLGNLQLRRGQLAAAATAYRRALALDPAFIDAHANLADLQRARGAEAEAVATLQAGLKLAPEAAALHHALGLARVRQGQREPALAHLRRASELAPDDARYSLVLAIALHDWGQPEPARALLAQALARQPNDRDLLSTLVRYLQQAGDLTAARAHLRHLQALEPDDPAVQQLAAWLGQ